MKSSIVLVMFATVTLFACGKAEQATAPAPAADAPSTPASGPADTPETAAPTAAPIAPDYTSAAPPVVAVPVTPAPPTAPPPAAKSVAPSPPAAVAPASPKAPEAAPAAPKPDLARGAAVYRQSCAVCHDKGIAGAPKTGDKTAWSPRLASGTDALYTSALNGKGAMPAKGGNPALSESDVKSAVDYLVAQSR